MRRSSGLARGAAPFLLAVCIGGGSAVALPSFRLPPLQRILPQIRLPETRSKVSPLAHSLAQSRSGASAQFRVPVPGGGQFNWQPSSTKAIPSPVPLTDSAAGVDPKHGSDLAFHLPVWTLGF